MKIFFLLTILMYLTTCLGQNLHQYSGKFQDGNATYQYYEDTNLERIFHGDFLYKKDNCSLSGRFKDNLRDGLWKASRTKINSQSNSKIIESLEANYKTGELDGPCSYIKTDINSKKILIKCEATFRKNKPIGKYTYFKNEMGTFSSIDAIFNLNSFIDSTLLIKYSSNRVKYEDIQIYSNGFLCYELFRDVADGRILRKIDRKKIINDISHILTSENIKVIIPYIEFSKRYEDLPIQITEIDDSREKMTKSYFYNELEFDGDSFDNSMEYNYMLAKNKNNNTIYFENAPFSYIALSLEFNFGYYYDLCLGLNFWKNIDLNFCEGDINPLYIIKRGANPVSFFPIKELVLHDDLFQIYQDSIRYEISRKEHEELLDSLRKVAINSVNWIKIDEGISPFDPSKKIEQYFISSTPINSCLYDSYFMYLNCTKFNHERTQKDLFEKENESILHKIDDLINNRIDNSFDINKYRDTPEIAEGLAVWLGFRVATIEELKYAIDKKFIEKMSSFVDFKIYRLAK